MSKIIFKTLRIIFFVTLLALALLPIPVGAANHSIKVLRVEGAIVPVVADYIDRGIEEAEARGNTIVIIELDTPGGLLDTTQKIVERILNARVPIVVYVSPAGGWAGSAGTFITIASNIAAMAPGSRIGAATPVSGSGEELSEEMQRKVTEDTAAFIRSIATLRGRNVEQAELAVREGKSYTASEAVENNLVDLQSSTIEELISQLNGMKVTLNTGEEIVLDTENYGLERTEMSWLERFLLAISNPNIAYILLSVGSIGIIAEIYNPGAIFPGVIGAISLIVAFYSLGVLNASLGGILLIVLAFGLFIGELLTTSFGLFTAGGVAALVLGSIFLFPKGGLEGSFFQVDWRLITGVVIAVTLVFTFVISRIVRAHRRQATTGREELIGKTALVKVALEPEGMILFKGENWTAISEKGKVKAGEEVTITGVDGLVLRVIRKQQKEEENKQA